MWQMYETNQNRPISQISQCHYCDVIMDTMASQITSLTIVYLTVYSSQIIENIKAPRHWPLCVGNSPLTGEFPTQMASNTENVSIWWRHHGTCPMSYNTPLRTEIRPKFAGLYFKMYSSDHSNTVVTYVKISLWSRTYILNWSNPNFGRISNFIEISLVGWAPGLLGLTEDIFFLPPPKRTMGCLFWAFGKKINLCYNKTIDLFY